MQDDDDFRHVAEVHPLSEADAELAKREAHRLVERMKELTHMTPGEPSVMRTAQIMAAAFGYTLLAMEGSFRDGNVPPCGTSCDVINLMNVAAAVPMTYLNERDELGWEMPGSGLASMHPEGNA